MCNVHANLFFMSANRKSAKSCAHSSVADPQIYLCKYAFFIYRPIENSKIIFCASSLIGKRKIFHHRTERDETTRCKSSASFLPFYDKTTLKYVLRFVRPNFFLLYQFELERIKPIFISREWQMFGFCGSFMSPLIWPANRKSQTNRSANQQIANLRIGLCVASTLICVTVICNHVAMARYGILGHEVDKRLESFAPCYSQFLLLADFTENHTIL